MDYRKYYEKVTCEKLTKDFHVHHLNGNRKDNRIVNLVAIPISLHASIHSIQIKIKSFIEDLRDNRGFILHDGYVLALNKYSKLRNKVFSYEMHRDSLIYESNDKIEIYDGVGLKNFTKTII